MNVTRLAGAKICEECDHVFTVRELNAENSAAQWGHPCFGTKGRGHGLRVRCESFRDELTIAAGDPIVKP